MPRGYVLQPTYRVREGRPVVQLFGKLESGEPFLIEDDRSRPCFFVRSRELEALRGERDATLVPTDSTDLAGAALTKVEVPVPSAVPPLRGRLAARGCSALEADIRFAYRYLIDRGIRASLRIEGAPERRGGLCVRHRRLHGRW